MYDFNDFELTADDYDNAAKNGISKDNLDQRFSKYGWDKDRAITQPIRKPRKHEDDYQKALGLGTDIDYRLFALRRENDWSVEEAALTPRNGRRKQLDRYTVIAKENGIHPATYHARRKRGWTREKAATVSADKRYQSRFKEDNR